MTVRPSRKLVDRRSKDCFVTLKTGDCYLRMLQINQQQTPHPLHHAQHPPCLSRFTPQCKTTRLIASIPAKYPDLEDPLTAFTIRSVSCSGDKPPFVPKAAAPPLHLRSTKHTSSFQSSVPVHRTGSSACNPSLGGSRWVLVTHPRLVTADRGTTTRPFTICSPKGHQDSS
ncbi:hypothetical protein BP00DRAFT_34103 [Aspergillus indologenus CBS 114.80]|uniref:Uncharacterized protein n=1 Tax=Aspergillus indologenus CBS 114.80 TaxID=1450541 RepID=A0A2V5HRQ4_9EURO|nr:hypothetical protein BP00DRAFT_34103 [Aspergillus indologenus CBS 114.80]